jgi:segregation and condensation protein B
MTIEQKKLKNIIEAALFAVGKPMSLEQISKLFEDQQRPSNTAIKEAIASLQQDVENRGIELMEVASGYRYQSRQDYSEWLSRLWEEKPAKYSRAALETLALIAYRQPVTRAEIEDVRGVGVSSSIIKTMLEREWIRVVGHRDVPGRPALYATTKQFLDYFNMKSLEELPSLAEIKDLEELNPELDLPNPDDEREIKPQPTEDGDGEALSNDTLAADELVDDEPSSVVQLDLAEPEIDGLDIEEPEITEVTEITELTELTELTEKEHSVVEQTGLSPVMDTDTDIDTQVE